MMSLALAEWKRDVLEGAADRFERRLGEETAMLRVEMAQMQTSLVRWMFVFWLGQIGVTLAMVGVVLRAVNLL